MHSTLNWRSKENLVNAFTKYGHKPSADQLAAVLAIQGVLTDMLLGTASPLYYLSSLDPGMGKTTSILTWLDAYVEERELYGDHGVLIVLDRLEEIQRWIKDASLPEDLFAVHVSDLTEEGVELNNQGLGRHRRKEALVLFTTKRQVRIRCDVQCFNDVRAFHYNGQPRRVKIWDESFTIGEQVVLNPNDFGALLSQLDTACAEAGDMILELLNDIRKFNASGTYFTRELPPIPKELENGNVWDSLRERTTAGHLWRMSGQPVSIRSNGKRKFLIDSGPKVPDDFMPCLILDASARVTAGYRLQHERWKNIHHLPESKKSYRNLDIRVWERRSGKGIVNDLKEVIPAIASLTREHPGEAFLVILHKDNRLPAKRELSKELSREQIAKVHFCTWGRHTATNDFCDIANIVMLSPYVEPDLVYEAATRAATATATAKGRPKQEEISKMKKGLIFSHILQAVNRGKVRKSEGDVCPPCRLWVIVHPNTGIPKEFPNIFPEARLTPWRVTAGNQPGGKQGNTLAHLQQLMKKGVTEVLAKTVREHMGITGSESNFTRDVIGKSAFVDALTGIGWECTKMGKSYIFRWLQEAEAA